MNRNLASSQFPFQKIANRTEFFLPRRYRRQSYLSSELVFLLVETHIVPAYRGDERGFHPARTPANNDHEGQLGLTAVPPGKEEFSAVGDFLKGELGRRKVSIHLNHKITADEVVQCLPDVVIVATGSHPLIPAIPGADRDNVVTAWGVLKGKPVGHNVIVVGGGLVGTETALFLSQKGKHVVLIEMLDDIVQDAGSLSRARLKEALKVTDIEIKCATKESRRGG